MSYGSGKSRQARGSRAKQAGLPQPGKRQGKRKPSMAPQSAKKTKLVPLGSYRAEMGVDVYASRLAKASPLEIVDLERNGVSGVFIKDLARSMEISSSRIFRIVGVPKATLEKRVASGKTIAGTGGHAAIGIARLLNLTKEMVAESTAEEAADFDAAKWLGQWIEKPQPSLGGRKPADLLDTPTGVEVVVRLLGAAQSGAYL